MKTLFAIAIALLLSTAAWSQITVDPVVPDVTYNPGPSADKNEARIAREVRHELLMLPYYTIFDDLGFTVRGSNVELHGDVTNGDIISQATKAVKRIEGVEKVENKINRLSPMPDDRRIRVEAARHLFGAAGLEEYGFAAAPSIRVIIRGGHIRLVGYVNNQSDKDRATIAVSGIPGAFEVKNDLQVVNSK